MGGQACVFYGAAEFSRDTDLAILASSENLARLKKALGDLQAEVAIAGLELQPAYPVGQRTWLPVVDIARRIKHDDHVVIEMTRVVDGDVSGSAHARCSQCSYFGRPDLPRSWPDELLPRHTRKSFNQRG